MKEPTTKIATTRTSLTLTVWCKGDREVYNIPVYVFTPKAPITIEEANKLVSKKHYYVPLTTTEEISRRESILADSVLLEVTMGEHRWLEQEMTASEWYMKSDPYVSDEYYLVRNFHHYTLSVTLYDRSQKKVLTDECFAVRSFRPLTLETITKQVQHRVPQGCTLLEIDTSSVKDNEQPRYMSEACAYQIWL